MGYSEGALHLRKPEVFELPRASERISFLFLDMVRIRQGRTGLVAENDSGEYLQIPGGSLSVLMLGPGVSMTSQAAVTLFRQGASVLYVAAEGAVGVASGRPLASRARWSEAQARIWVDDEARLSAARLMYRHRYPDLALPENAPLRVLRGIEGRVVRDLYSDMARKHSMGRWRRVYGREGEARDPVNELLDLGNSILYGSALAASSALALNPALGFIHQGAANALLFDLADPHKARSSIPLAFELGSSGAPATIMRRRMRDYLHRSKALRSHLSLLDEILAPHMKPSEHDTLLDDSGSVPGHRNFSGG